MTTSNGSKGGTDRGVEDIEKYISELEYVKDEGIRKKLGVVVDSAVKKLLKNHEATKDEVPREIFVSLSNGGGRIDMTVWLFTKSLIVRIRNPIDKERIQYEMARFENAVDWIRINTRRFDLEQTHDDSEFDLEFSTMDGLSHELSASGDGCRKLMELYEKQFLPNFKMRTGD